MIQGGHFNLNIEHVTCLLHPLNMATPLGDIKCLRLVGLIYLTALSPETKGLTINEKMICVPVKCPLEYGPSCDYGVVLKKAEVPVHPIQGVPNTLKIC